MNLKNILVFFVAAPAWQIFSLLMFPVILVFVVSVSGESIFIIQALWLLGSWIILLWIYSTGVLIYEKFSSFLTVPIVRFKICLAYAFVDSVVFIFGIIPGNYLVPFHIISFVCRIYALYFVSKLIVIIEIKGEVKFKDYFGTFLMAFILFIGIWSLQPRINKIVLSNDQ